MDEPRSRSPQSSPLIIRPAQPQDYPAIASIYNEAIAHGGITMDDRPYDGDDIQKNVDKMGDREALVVGCIGDRVVGWGIIKRYSDRIGYQVCCETSIYLSFSETGKGYGHLIQQTLLTKVAALGYHHVVAKIGATNHGSIRFHERFGFTLVGIQKEIGCIRGVWHDVAILQYLVPKN